MSYLLHNITKRFYLRMINYIMRACLVKYFIIAILVKKIAPRKMSHERKHAIEARQNIWELGNELEGDMLGYGRRNLCKNETYRWPNNTVPYLFDAFYDEQQRQWFKHCLTEITNNSCINVRLKTEDDKDYVFVTEIGRGGCSSYIGKIGGRQILNLKRSIPGRGCFQRSVIVHEFLHVLGFTHQQSVTNRDDYIKINYENIKPGKERDFKAYPTDSLTNLDERYDYYSIMHYSSYAKSKNGKRTIERKNSSVPIIKNLKLSEIDIRKLKKAYPCSKRSYNDS